MVSIHAPAKGATSSSRRRPGNTKFRSTLPRRERLFEAELSECSMKFRSTLPRRERPRFPNWLRRQRKVSSLREPAQIAGAEAVDGSIGKENIIFSNLL